jgi:hypothetical protein
MTTNLANDNNRVARKTLASQIDRLDNMLDGLADGLNEAVADAVKNAVADAVREAVQAVLGQVLTNPDLVTKVRTAHGTDGDNAPPPKETKGTGPSFGERVRNLAGGVCKACAAKARRVWDGFATFRRETGQRLATLWACRYLVRHFKGSLLIALAIGTMLSVSLWFASQFFGSLGASFGSLATTLALQTSLWLRRVWHGLKTAA